LPSIIDAPDAVSAASKSNDVVGKPGRIFAAGRLRRDTSARGLRAVRDRTRQIKFAIARGGIEQNVTYEFRLFRTKQAGNEFVSAAENRIKKVGRWITKTVQLAAKRRLRSEESWPGPQRSEGVSHRRPVGFTLNDQ